jgi:hypothetical protein
LPHIDERSWIGGGAAQQTARGLSEIVGAKLDAGVLRQSSRQKFLPQRLKRLGHELGVEHFID